jgi:hypothetical protein
LAHETQQVYSDSHAPAPSPLQLSWEYMIRYRQIYVGTRYDTLCLL